MSTLFDALKVTPTEQAAQEMRSLVAQRNAVLVSTGVKRTDLSVIDLNLSIHRASRRRLTLELARIRYRLN